MKKILILMLAIGAIYFVSCSKTNDKPTIAYLMADNGNPFFEVIRNSVETNGANAGYNVVIYDAQNDASKQPSQVEDAVIKQVDAIFIDALDQSSVTNSLKKAAEANIPVICIDRCVSDTTNVLRYITSENYKGGYLAGEWLIKNKPEGASIVHVQGIIGSSSQIARSAGFLDAIAKNDKFNVVASVSGNFSMAPSEAAMSDVLQSGKKFDVVYAENDTSAVGVVRAIQNSDYQDKEDIWVIGFDGAKEAYDLIDQGKMKVTVVQDFVTMGKLAVQMIDGYLTEGTKSLPEDFITYVNCYMSDSK